jgi:hypothetical protein
MFARRRPPEDSLLTLRFLDADVMSPPSPSPAWARCESSPGCGFARSVGPDGDGSSRTADRSTRSVHVGTRPESSATRSQDGRGACTLTLRGERKQVPEPVEVHSIARGAGTGPVIFERQVDTTLGAGDREQTANHLSSCRAFCWPPASPHAWRRQQSHIFAPAEGT